MFIGSLLLGGFDYVSGEHRGGDWALCNGQLLSFTEYPAVASLLRNRYGGDVRSNFALPKVNGNTGMTDANGVPLIWIIRVKGDRESYPDPAIDF